MMGLFRRGWRRREPGDPDYSQAVVVVTIVQGRGVVQLHGEGAAFDWALDHALRLRDQMSSDNARRD